MRMQIISYTPSERYGEIVVKINVLNNSKGYWTKNAGDTCGEQEMKEMIWITNRNYLLEGEGICIKTPRNTLARIILEEVTDTHLILDVTILWSPDDQ